VEANEYGRTVLEAGRLLLTGSLILTLAVICLALLGILRKDRRLVAGARSGFYGLLVLVGGSAGCLVYGFLTGQYDNSYVFNYSEQSLALPFKLAGLWAGLDGSVLFWSLILTGFSAAVAFQHHWSSQHPVGRRLEPWVYVVLASVLLFFLLITYQFANPFEFMDLLKRHELAQRLGISMDPGGGLQDGRGLNPQLENYWMAIHPPTLYLGFVGFTVPFAFAIASLITREMGDYWIRITRRWTMISWVLLTNGIILGGLWAYEMLGWGGYWAWDPVENASLFPWFAGTAFIHSVMIQERRDMLKAWNVFLIFFTFFLTIIATYMTRSGVVSSVHAFAGGGQIGAWFLGFMGLSGAASLFLLFFRFGDLRGKHQLESPLSREAAFYFNNLVLVALALAVLFISLFPKFSHDFLGRSESVGIPHYNRITTPLWILLVFLTAVGPQLGWVKTSPENLKRNLLVPALAGAAAIPLLYGFWFLQGTVTDLKKAVYPLFYPVAILIALSVFIFASIFTEFHRGIRTRVRHRGENILQGFLSLFVLNNRRYGGYIVHLGFGVMVTGIVVSSFFRVKREDMSLQPGDRGTVGKYEVEVAPYNPVNDFRRARIGQPFDKDVARFTIRDGSGSVLASLRPERHYYPKQENLVRTPAISRGFINDFYISFTDRTREGKVIFTIFVNPLVNWIWFGWLLMMAGGLLAILPMPVRRVGLAE